MPALLQALKAEKRPDGVWYYLLHYNGWNKVPHDVTEPGWATSIAYAVARLVRDDPGHNLASDATEMG